LFDIVTFNCLGRRKVRFRQSVLSRFLRLHWTSLKQEKNTLKMTIAFVIVTRSKTLEKLSNYGLKKNFVI